METINHCMICSAEQQYVDEGMFYCERCGAKNNGDGSGEYDGSREGIEDMERRMEDYDRQEDERTH